MLADQLPVPAPGGHERRQLPQLGTADCRLQVECFQVVAHVRVGVLVVEAEREITQLIAEAFPAGVVLPWLAPAIAAPIAERAGDPVELAARRQDRAALARGDLMRRIERERREMPEGPDRPAID